MLSEQNKYTKLEKYKASHIENTECKKTYDAKHFYLTANDDKLRSIREPEVQALLW